MHKFASAFASLILVAGSAVADESATASDESRAPPLSTQPTCLKETGSRIPRRNADDCIAASGRAYDRQDLDRTGRPLVGDALRNLDPSISIRGH